MPNRVAGQRDRICKAGDRCGLYFSEQSLWPFQAMCVEVITSSKSLLRIYAAAFHSYRWCRPPSRALEAIDAVAVGLGSTGRRFGVSFSKES